MDRTLGADYVDIGAGKRGFRDQNRAAGLIGTEVNAPWLNGLQEEVMAVIEDADIAPDKDNWTQLLEAIDKKIEAVRVSQPIYPDVLTIDGKFTVTQTAAGVVSVAAGTTWTMRGGAAQTSVLTPLNTAPSKVYHLRYRNGAFGLFDIASLVYNPAALLEADTSFDSTYDDMLVAKVQTDGANVATITTLSNKARLKLQQNQHIFTPAALYWTVKAGTGIALNWARTPIFTGAALNEFRNWSTGPTPGTQTPAGKGMIVALGVRVSTVTPPSRYQCSDFEYYYEDDQYGMANQDGAISVLLTAEAA